MRLEILHKPGRILAQLHNLVFDLIYCGRYLGWLKAPVSSDALVTSSTDYLLLKYIFITNRAELPELKDNDVFVDVGCGYGRVVLWLARTFKRSRIVGVELNTDVADIAKTCLSKYKNSSIEAGDILERFPSEGTVFYLFNPFSAHMVAKFKERIFVIIGLTSVYESVSMVTSLGGASCQRNRLPMKDVVSLVGFWPNAIIVLRLLLLIFLKYWRRIAIKESSLGFVSIAGEKFGAFLGVT